MNSHQKNIFFNKSGIGLYENQYLISRSMKKWISFFLVCLHLNTWMLVPHIEHNSSVIVMAGTHDDMDSFFEFMDEVVFSHADQTPDHEENDGQLLDEVTSEEFCDKHNLPAGELIKLEGPFSTFKKSSSDEYKERISLDIIAPPPDLS
jgi:hypothetical protein